MDPMTDTPKKATRSTKKAAEHDHQVPPIPAKVKPDAEAVAAAEAEPAPITEEPTQLPEPGTDPNAGLPQASPDEPAMPREKAHAAKEDEPEAPPLLGDPDRPRDTSSADTEPVPDPE